jgi:hypothetical protein
MGVGEGVNVAVGTGVFVDVGDGVNVTVAVGAAAKEEHAERIKTGINNARKVWLILFRMGNILPLVAKIPLIFDEKLSIKS